MTTRDRDRAVLRRLLATTTAVHEIPDTRYPAATITVDGRQYVVSLQPMPTVTNRDDGEEDDAVTAMRQRRRRDTLDAPDDYPL
jgi:hypothetical protein